MQFVTGLAMVTALGFVRSTSFVCSIVLLITLLGTRVWGQAPAWTWARSLPGEAAAQVAASPFRPGFYVTGALEADLAWGRDTLHCACGEGKSSTSYLLRQAGHAAGNWAIRLPGTVLGVAADQNGRAYVVGMFRLPVSAADSNAAPAYQTQVLCYDSVGRCREQWNVPGQAGAFAVGPRGHVVVLHTLEYEGSNPVGADQLTCFGPTGQQQWTRPVLDTVSGLHAVNFGSLGVDGQGGVWVMGGFDGTLSLEAIQASGRRQSLLALPSATDSAWQESSAPKPFTNLLLRYSAQGKLRRVGTIVTHSGPDKGVTALAVAPTGDLYVVGGFEKATLQMQKRAPQKLASMGSGLLCVRANGSAHWLSPLPYSATALALNRLSQPCVLAVANGGDDAHPALPTYQKAHGTDVWVGRYSQYGKQLLAGLHGGGGNHEEATGLAVDGRDMLLIAGLVRSRNLPPVPGRTRFGNYAFDTQRDYGQDLHIVYDSTGRVTAARRLNPLDSPSPEQVERLREKRELVGAVDFYSLAGRLVSTPGLHLLVPMVADQRGNTYALAELKTALTQLQEEEESAGFMARKDVGSPDYVLLKFEPEGHLRWARRITTTKLAGFTQPQLVVDWQGNAFLAAVATGQLAFDGQPVGSPAAQAKLLLLKVDSLGRMRWARSGNVGVAQGENLWITVAADGQGGLVAVGTSTGAVEFDQCRLPALVRKQASEIGYLVAFDAAGKTRWLRGFRATGASTLGFIQLCVPAGGGSPTLFLDTHFRPGAAVLRSAPAGGTLVVDAGAAGAAPVRQPLGTSNSRWLVRYDAAGRLHWVRAATRSDVRSYTASWPPFLAATDAHGNSYLVGRSCPVVIADGLITPVADCNQQPTGTFLACYDANGRVRWLQCMPGQARREIKSLVVSKSGFCYLAGEYSVLTGWAGSTNSPRKLWISAYDSAGTLRWLEESLGENNETHLGLSIDGRNQLHQTCQFMPVRPPDVAGDTFFGPVRLSGVVPVNTSDSSGEYELGITPFLAALYLPAKGHQ